MCGRTWFMVSVLAVLGSVAFAGCVDSGAVEGSYKDADERYTHSFSGGHSQQETFNVPAGTSELRVGLHYEVSGGFTVQLFSPTGMAKDLSEGGVASKEDGTWYRTSSPAPGEWRLQVSTGGNGAYTVGIYLE